MISGCLGDAEVVFRVAVPRANALLRGCPTDGGEKHFVSAFLTAVAGHNATVAAGHEASLDMMFYDRPSVVLGVGMDADEFPSYSEVATPVALNILAAVFAAHMEHFVAQQDDDSNTFQNTPPLRERPACRAFCNYRVGVGHLPGLSWVPHR